MEYLLDFVQDVALGYGAVAAVSCAWFSYQWFSIKMMPAVEPMCVDNITRAPTTVPPPEVPVTTQLKDVLLLSAIAPACALHTVLCTLLLKPTAQPNQWYYLRRSSSARAIHESIHRQDMGYIKAKYFDMHDVKKQ